MIDPPDVKFREALRDLKGAFQEIRRPAMIIGGLAVVARGVPRLTIDIDATVRGSDASLDKLFEVLQRHRMIQRIPGALDFARHRQVLLLVHEPTQTPLDVSLAWLPFEEEALERATTVEIGEVRLPVARAEDLIVYKMVAWRRRDKDDIERLLVLHRTTIDLDRIRRLVAEFAEALDDPGRSEGFEELLRRSSGRAPEDAG